MQCLQKQWPCSWLDRPNVLKARAQLLLLLLLLQAAAAVARILCAALRTVRRILRLLQPQHSNDLQRAMEMQTEH